MAKRTSYDKQTLALIGMCLLCVQQAEDVLSSAVVSVMERPNMAVIDQPKDGQRKTLGDFLLRLKRQTKIEHGLKEKLFKFLDMRNKFVHEFSKVPEWNLTTEKGREAARLFLIELMIAAVSTTSLFATLFHVSAKDDFGEDLFEGEEENARQLAKALEGKFGTLARSILAGRYRKPLLVRR